MMNRLRQYLGLLLAIFAFLPLAVVDQPAFAQRVAQHKPIVARAHKSPKPPKRQAVSRPAPRKPVAKKPTAGRNPQAVARNAAKRVAKKPVPKTTVARRKAQVHAAAKPKVQPRKPTRKLATKPVTRKPTVAKAKKRPVLARAGQHAAKPNKKRTQVAHKPPKRQQARRHVSPVSHRVAAVPQARKRTQPARVRLAATPVIKPRPPVRVASRPTPRKPPAGPQLARRSVPPTAQRPVPALPTTQPIPADRATAHNWRSSEDTWFNARRLPGQGDATPTFDGVGRANRLATAAPAAPVELRPAVNETPGVTYIADGGAVANSSQKLRTALSAQAQRVVGRAPTRSRLAYAERTRRVRVPDEPTTMGQRVVSLAKRFLGLPYVYGAASPRVGFDCSGLVMYVYQKFGVSLPHRADLQFNYGRNVDKSNLRPGDLVFFRELGGRDIGHVGIYVGGQRFMHASTTGKPLKIDNLLAPNYVRRYMGAKRLVTH